MCSTRIQRFPFPVAIVLAFVAPLWGQTTYNVPGDFGTIQQALVPVVDGDTVQTRVGFPTRFHSTTSAFLRWTS